MASGIILCIVSHIRVGVTSLHVTVWVVDEYMMQLTSHDYDKRRQQSFSPSASTTIAMYYSKM